MLPFRVWLTDVDVSIMNHAAMMTVMEAGRIDLMVRSGFFKLARKNHWYFPSSGFSVQFFRPLKLFQKAVLTTRVCHVNDQWIYLEQKIARKGKLIAMCLVKSTIRNGRETVNIPEVIRLLGNQGLPVGDEQLVSLFEKQNQLLRDRAGS